MLIARVYLSMDSKASFCMLWHVVLSCLNIDVSFLFCCLIKGCSIWNLITNTLNFLYYFSGLQVDIGDDSYSYPGEVMQSCKTATQHCREGEDLCSSFNLDVAEDSVISCNQVISLSFKT